MTVTTGRRGRPRRPALDPTLQPLIAEAQAADEAVLAAVRAHAVVPSQRATVDLLNAQFRVASLRAHLARRTGNDNAAKHETELAIKLAGARDDAVGRLWGDDLDRLHELVTQAGAVQVTINAELASELAEV